jgi:hypothetical protein
VKFDMEMNFDVRLLVKSYKYGKEETVNSYQEVLQKKIKRTGGS